MKKVFILVESKDAKNAIASLRRLGVVHIEHQKEPKGEDIASLQEDLSFIDKAMGILISPEFHAEKVIENSDRIVDWRFAARHLVDLNNRYNQLKEYSKNLYDKISQWETWGDFDPAVVGQLTDKGVYIKFYQIPSKELGSISSENIVRVIAAAKGMSNCVIVTRQNINMPYEEIKLPPMSLEKMKQRFSEDRKAMECIKNDIKSHAGYYPRFVAIKKAFDKELEFHEAIRGMGQAKEISYLKGYVPKESTGSVVDYAKQERRGIFLTDPSDDDNVPTLVRNPAWISLINPVFKLIEIVPGYRELDISIWFLIFLSVFFGMLVGDAAYGTIFFILTLFAQAKWGKKVQSRSIFILIYLFSSCAFIWGLLTGTFFGQEWLAGRVQPLAPALRDDRNVQALCFLLGAVHLSIAHIWRAIIKIPSPKALSDIGWVIILWGGFFLAKTLVLGYSFPEYGKWFFIIGPIFVILFTDVRKNILKGIGNGMGSLLLSVVNTFTDVVSYIRLFAVGLATVAVADSFNKMAMDIGFKNIASSAITALILLIGHSLNIALGPMSVLVHGVRLNVLEFCSHLDIKWNGFNYKPLKEER